jgi:hypothetical protein
VALEFTLAEAARRDAEVHVVSVVPMRESWPVSFGMSSYSAAMPSLDEVWSPVTTELRTIWPQ